MDDNSILALTRGTSYDDLLISNLTGNDNQTSHRSGITETMGVMEVKGEKVSLFMGIMVMMKFRVLI
jgi:hypothetical protein